MISNLPIKAAKDTLAMTTQGIQEQFVSMIKSKLPAGISLAEVLADELNISSDSAYRRIRGDTLFTIDEIVKLSKEYKISLDSLYSNTGDHVTFQHITIDNKKLGLGEFFEKIVKDFKEAEAAEYAEVLYLARDLPFFYLLQFPEICAFKMFLWQMLYEDPNQSSQTYNPDIIDKNLVAQARQIWDLFVKVPSIEIWGHATFEALLEEIWFMWESLRIENKEIALKLCDKARELIEHVKKQAEFGYKFTHGQQPVERKDNFKLYFKEFQLTHNKIMINGAIKRIYIPTSLDTLITSDNDYFERNYYLFGNSIKRSTLISGTGEPGRNRYIDNCISKANRLREKIELSD